MKVRQIFDLINGLMTISFAIAGITLNGFVINGYKRQINRKERKLFYFFLVNQVYADLFNCLSHSLFAGYYFIANSFYTTTQTFDGFGVYLFSIFATTITSSLLLFIMIGVEWLFAITKPVVHRSYCTKGILTKLVICLWVISFIAFIPEAIVLGRRYETHGFNLHLFMLVFNSILIVKIIILWLLTFMKSRYIRNRSLSSSVSSKDGRSTSSSELRRIGTFATMVTSFLIAHLAVLIMWAVVVTVRYIERRDLVKFGDTLIISWVISTTTLTFSSIFNPILTLIRVPKLRT